MTSKKVIPYQVFCLHDSNGLRHVDKDVFISTAQDRSPFYIFHIMNEISQHPDLMDTFLVGNHWYIFWEDYQIKCSQHFKKH